MPLLIVTRLSARASATGARERGGASCGSRASAPVWSAVLPIARRLLVRCATGATPPDTATGSDDIGSGPAVALSDPGAPLPTLPELGPSDGSHATTLTPFLGPRPFGLVAPFAITSCKPGAFCDDFEEPSPAKRWTSTIAISGIVDFPGPSSSMGAHALRASTSAAGGTAYLTRHGAAVGSSWVGALAFSLRIDALPVAALGGPEIAIVDASGTTTHVGFSVTPEGIALHQVSESCGGSTCTSRSDLVSDVKPGEWRHLVVAVETYGTTSSPYGRIEVSVDDGGLIVLPLTVMPYDGLAEARPGITVADVAPATARIDDVTFYAYSPYSPHSP
jgi:hypothetical protein